MVMKMIKLVMIGMLLGGATAFADLSPGGDSLASELAEIRARAAHLNGEFSGLHLRTREDIYTKAIADKTLQDLKDLDVVLHDTTLVPVNMLVNIACAKAVCAED
jgi:hypothetical protein